MQWLKDRFGEGSSWGAIALVLLAVAMFAPLPALPQTMLIVGAIICALLAFGLADKIRKRL
jgi:hypothetical protein